MAVVTMRQLLESGVHFGHQTRRWNPKMKRFIMTERNGIYIIDLQQSLAYIDRSYAFIKETVAKGGTVMFVGTKKQAQEAIAEQATRVGMPYVNQRWLGGMLTNFQTVNQRINRLKELDEIDFEDVAGSSRTKKELLQMRRERDKLNKSLGGIREMSRTPAAVWIVDTNKEHLAVEEARKLHIPIIGILDSNCDPDLVDFPIPGNDDAIRAVGLLTRVVADAVAEGLIARSGAKAGTEGAATVGAEEPLAEWERELLGGDADKAAADKPLLTARCRQARRGEAGCGEARRRQDRRRDGGRGHRRRRHRDRHPGVGGHRCRVRGARGRRRRRCGCRCPRGPRPGTCRRGSGCGGSGCRGTRRPGACRRGTRGGEGRAGRGHRGRVRRRLRRSARGRLRPRGLRHQGQQDVEEVPRPQQPLVRPHQRRGLVPYPGSCRGRGLRQRRVQVRRLGLTGRVTGTPTPETPRKKDHG